MIELKRHIEILLLDNDCVVVPGLGGFVAHHIDARYDARDGVYLPPLRTLGFNQKLDMNDSLLAQSYVEAYDMSYPEAMRKIDEEVGELKSVLEKDGFYDLSDIGTLVVNADGRYEFDPCESGILTPSLYGLSSVDVSLLLEDGVTATIPAAIDMPVKSITEEQGGSEKSAAQQSQQVFPYGESKLAEKLCADGDVDSEKTISIKVSLIRNVLAVACAVLAFFMLATPINNVNDETSVSMSGIGSGLLYNLVSRDANSGVTNVVGEKINAIPSAKSGNIMDKKIEPPIKRVEPVSKQKDMQTEVYCIVLACRITKSNADAFVKSLHEHGLVEARVLEQEGESLKVVYGNYESKMKALSELTQLRENEMFSSSWIYKEN